MVEQQHPLDAQTERIRDANEALEEQIDILNGQNSVSASDDFDSQT